MNEPDDEAVEVVAAVIDPVAFKVEGTPNDTWFYRSMRRITLRKARAAIVALDQWRAQAAREAQGEAGEGSGATLHRQDPEKALSGAPSVSEDFVVVEIPPLPPGDVSAWIEVDFEKRTAEFFAMKMRETKD